MKYPRILCILSIFMPLWVLVLPGLSMWVQRSGLQALRRLSLPMILHTIRGIVVILSGICFMIHLNQMGLQDQMGHAGWNQGIKDAESTSELKHLTPANVADSKYQSPCPLCGDPTYFWLSAGDLDSDTEKLHKR